MTVESISFLCSCSPPNCMYFTMCSVLITMILSFYFSATTLITSVCLVSPWLCVSVHTAGFFCVCVFCVCIVHVFLSICMCCYILPPPPNALFWHTPPPPSESQEVSVDSAAAVGGVAIPEINVTGVTGERMPNGESLRPRTDGRAHPDCDPLGAASEVSMDPRAHDSGTRGQEVRRQKSVRRMVENEGSGLASTGRSQY